MITLAINGFGRIGRITLRNLLNRPNVKVVAINDLTGIKTLAHLLKYDSVHGKFPGTIEVQDNALIINGNLIKVFGERDPGDLPWGSMNIDVVLECTGVFRTKEKASLHIAAGAKKVVISAPAQGGNVPTLVKGVNDEIVTSETDIISNASCTTNCAAPVIKIIHDAFVIEHGALTTVHAYTADQNILDAPHRDLRRARSAAHSIIPTSTGAAKAVGIVIPDLAGKLEGMACRVPVPVGSFTDLTLVVQKEATKESINELIKQKCQGKLAGIIEYVDEDIVSADIVGNPHSCIFDADLTAVNGNLVKIGAWYDNEFGYSARLADATERIGAYVDAGILV